jgi:Cu/Ag efflux protein CusF
MKHVMVTLVGLALTGTYAGAQMTPAPLAPPAQVSPSDFAMPQAQAVQGKIRTLDRVKKTLTLEDGTKLTFPEYVKVTPAALKRGAMISAIYEEQGGQKLVTSIEVQPPLKS